MQKPQFRRRWLAHAGIVALLVAAYAAAGFLGVPALVDSQAKKFVKESYGRDLAIGKVRFNPFTLTLEIEKLALPDADGTPLLGFDRLLVNLGVESLWRRALSFQAIVVDGLAVDAVIRRGGALNLADLEPKAPATTPPAAASQPLPRVDIDDLQINNGRVHYEDRNRPTPFATTVSPITFRLADFSTYGAGERYQLDARLFDSGRLAWRGTLSAQPLASQGEFSLAGIPLPQVASLLGDVVPMVVASGQATLRGEYRLAAGNFQVDDGEVTITSLAVRPRAAAMQGSEKAGPDYISLDKVVASGLKLSLSGKQAEVGKLALDGGQVDAWLSSGGELNLAALAGPAATSTSTSAGASRTPAVAPPAQSAPWVVRLPDVELAGLAVHLEDRRMKPAATMLVQPLQASIKGYSTAPGSVIASRLAATINGTGRVTVDASTNLDSLASTASIELSDLPLDIVQPYIAAETSMTLTGGTLAVKGKATYATGEPSAASAVPRIAFDGDVAVSDLRTIDNALKEDFVKWDRLGLREVRYQSMPQRLRIGTIELRRPYARVVIAPDGTSNVSAILAGPGATATAAPGPTLALPAGQAGTPPATAATRAAAGSRSRPPIPFPVQVGMVRIEDGSARFADLTTKPNFDIGMEKLKGTIVGLSSAPNSRAKVVIDGQVNDFSPVTIRGQVNPLAAESYMDLSMTLRNLELASFTPYSGRFAGYSIRKGKLSADLHYKVQDRKLDADHKFVIDQFELGDKVDSPDATHLPLKLAVALLKDRNGVIDLNLPVTGDLDDPQFRIGPIVWKVFVNLVTKAATAPFALLGKLFGGGAEINRIVFAPGQATLDAGNLERIGSLVKALTERPGLKLSVPATYNRAADLPALKQAALEREVAGFREAELAGRQKPGASADFATITSDPKAYQRILEEIYRKQYGQKFAPPAAAGGQPAPVIPALEAAIRDKLVVGDAGLYALATARATGIQQRLLTDTGIDPTRVFLTAPAEGPAGDAGVVLDLELR